MGDVFMRLQEIAQYKGLHNLTEAKQRRTDSSQKVIKAIGQHIGEFQKTNQQINKKIYLMNELLKILLSASVHQEYINQEIIKKGLKNK